MAKKDMKKHNESLKKMVKTPPKSKPKGKVITGKVTRVKKK